MSRSSQPGRGTGSVQRTHLIPIITFNIFTSQVALFCERCTTALVVTTDWASRQTFGAKERRPVPQMKAGSHDVLSPEQWKYRLMMSASLTRFTRRCYFYPCWAYMPSADMQKARIVVARRDWRHRTVRPMENMTVSSAESMLKHRNTRRSLQRRRYGHCRLLRSKRRRRRDAIVQ